MKLRYNALESVELSRRRGNVILGKVRATSRESLFLCCSYHTTLPDQQSYLYYTDLEDGKFYTLAEIEELRPFKEVEVIAK